MAYNSRWNLYIFLVCEIDPHLLTAVASCNEAEILAEQAAVLHFSGAIDPIRDSNSHKKL